MTNEPTNDPFLIEPSLWFGVLCEGFQQDQRGKLTLQNIVSQFRLMRPPPQSGIRAYAHIQAVLAVGAIGGLGTFTADIHLVDQADNTIYQVPETWTMNLEGAVNSAVFLRAFEQWITEPGTYRFKVRLRERPIEWTVRFEVAEQIGPAA